jgi:uncharacterized membrane protein YgdD (TMEM256/DUF423 family)
MTNKPLVVVGVLVIVALIVSLDVLLLRDHAWARLLVNVGIVCVCGGLYLRFARPSLTPATAVKPFPPRGFGDW